MVDFCADSGVHIKIDISNMTDNRIVGFFMDERFSAAFYRTNVKCKSQLTCQKIKITPVLADKL
jgi:hypothetical protein